MIRESITRADCLRILKERPETLKELKNSKVVVIGGTGFTGAWISEMIAALNDDFGYKIGLTLISRNPENLAATAPHLARRADIKMLKADVRQLGNFPMDANWIIHAAANPDIRLHASKPLETASVIADGTYSVIRIAERLSELKKILYLSSGLVYGNNLVSDSGQNETDLGAPPLDASHVYANSKRFAETLCAAARIQSRIPVLVARPFSFIGPYQPLETPWAQTTFLSDALSGHAIRVLGDGQIIRSYLYGSDSAFWLLKIMTHGQPGDTVNVGSPAGIKIEDLAREIARNFTHAPDILLNTAPRTVRKSLPLLPDTSHAEKEYGLTQFTPLEAAIQSTIAWHRNSGTI
jgi:nucleoside-diphosphate-sugar epimerase